MNLCRLRAFLYGIWFARRNKHIKCRSIACKFEVFFWWAVSFFFLLKNRYLKYHHDRICYLRNIFIDAVEHSSFLLNIYKNIKHNRDESLRNRWQLAFCVMSPCVFLTVGGKLILFLFVFILFYFRLSVVSVSHSVVIYRSTSISITLVVSKKCMPRNNQLYLFIVNLF